MKTAELFETQKKDTFIGGMIQRLFNAKKPLKVLVTGILTATSKGTKKEPDQLCDVVGINISSTGELIIRTDNKLVGWFSIEPEDDDRLTIKKLDDYWLLTSIDGKGVHL